MDDSYYKNQEPFFGSWKIEKKIGEGGTGKVYLITNNDGDQISCGAMKAISIPSNDTEISSIKAEFQKDEELRYHYQCLVDEVVNELMLIDRLSDCENIVTYYEHEVREHEGKIGWDIFIREEKLTPLIDVLASRNLTENEIINVGIDICSALEACEAERVIHRDIKPENIFVDDNGRYKLGDFGIAKIMSKTIDGITKKGTYEYMAPEVYRKESGSTQVDVYSLGIVLYKMLNENRGPFLPSYPDAIMYSDREAALSRRFKGAVITPPKNGSEPLRQAVLTACAFYPAERFKSAADMRAALEKVQDGQPANTLSKPKANPLRKVVAVALAILGVCAVAGFLTWWGQIKDIAGIEPEIDVYIGEQMAPEYQIIPARNQDKPIEFKVSGDAISVDSEGKISGQNLGQAVMIMTAGKYAEKVVVNVVPKVTGFTGNPKKLKLFVGDEYQLNLTPQPTKFKSEKIVYSSSKSSIVNVDKRGLLQTAKEGRAVITLEAGGCTDQLTVDVQAKPEPKVIQKQNRSTSQTKAKKTKKQKKSKKPYSNMGTFGGDEYF